MTYQTSPSFPAPHTPLSATRHEVRREGRCDETITKRQRQEKPNSQTRGKKNRSVMFGFLFVYNGWMMVKENTPNKHAASTSTQAERQGVPSTLRSLPLNKEKRKYNTASLPGCFLGARTANSLPPLCIYTESNPLDRTANNARSVEYCSATCSAIKWAGPAAAAAGVELGSLN